jgi:hypothetical protein
MREVRFAFNDSVTAPASLPGPPEICRASGKRGFEVDRIRIFLDGHHEEADFTHHLMVQIKHPLRRCGDFA